VFQPDCSVAVTSVPWGGGDRDGVNRRQTPYRKRGRGKREVFLKGSGIKMTWAEIKHKGAGETNGALRQTARSQEGGQLRGRWGEGFGKFSEKRNQPEKPVKQRGGGPRGGKTSDNDTSRSQVLQHGDNSVGTSRNQKKKEV